MLFHPLRLTPAPSPRLRPVAAWRLLLPVLALLALAAPGHAAMLNVPTTAYPTIQAAVTAAGSGDTVIIADGTYSGVGNRDIDFGGKSLTVQSASGDSAKTVIDCGGSSSANHRGFYIHSGETAAVISGLTIKNGYVSYNGSDANSGRGGGILVHNVFNGGVLIQNCTVSGNTAGSSGGGVYNDNVNGTITLTGCTIAGNTGDGVFDYNGNSNDTITLTDCTISGNMAQSGGGVFNYNDDCNGTITLTNCTISGNTAQFVGGGVLNVNGGDYVNDLLNFHGIITLTNCTISDNTAQSGAGGIYIVGLYSRGTSTLINCILFGDIGGEITTGTYSIALFTYCDIQGGYGGTGNITADPLFVNAAGGDFHLQPGSPCLGAGASMGAPTTDKDGKMRPNPPSIGAYEVSAPGHTHLLWNNSDGRVMLWSVAPDGSFTLNGFGPYTDNYVSNDPNNKWSATALATGSDGKSHLLWNNTDGRVMLWTVDDSGNFTYAGYGPYTDDSVGSNPSVNKWHATAVSVGPDNTVHLLWNNTDHRVMLWNVAPDFNFTLAGYGPYTDNAPQNLWSATALATGPDNVTRIAWNNTDYRVMLWNVNADFSFTLAGYGPYTDNAPQNLWSVTAVSAGP